jgi:hypothetical protein
MARNGQNSGGVVDFGSLLQQSNERAARLKELGKRHGELQKARAQLDKDEASFMKEVQSLGLGNSFATSRPARQQPKATRKPANKGEGKTKTAKPQAKAQKRSNGSKNKGNGNGQRGVPLHNILLTVLPASTEDSITKDEIATRVYRRGLHLQGGEPEGRHRSGARRVQPLHEHGSRALAAVEARRAGARQDVLQRRQRRREGHRRQHPRTDRRGSRPGSGAVRRRAARGNGCRR